MPKSEHPQSGRKGIYWRDGKDGADGAWVVELRMPDGGRMYIGRYRALADAVKEQKAACLQYWGREEWPSDNFDPYEPTAQERAELDALEYPENPVKTFNRMMKEAV